MVLPEAEKAQKNAKRDPLKSKAKMQATTAKEEKQAKKKRKVLTDHPQTADTEGKKKP